MTCRVVVRLLPILGQSVCQLVTQPIRLVRPDLLKNRLPKLTEHAAHSGMVIGARTQHGLWVTPVAQWLQQQGMHWARSCHRQEYRGDCVWSGPYLVRTEVAGRDHSTATGKRVAEFAVGIVAKDQTGQTRGKTLSVDSVEYASGGAAWRLARLYS